MVVRLGLRRLRRAVRFLWVPCVLTAFCYLTAGCQGNLLTYKGGNVPQGESIILLDGEHSGFWPTRDLRVNYTYSKKSDQLNISGDVRFADWLGLSFNNIEFFNLQLFLLSNQGTVLQAAGLATSPSFASSRMSLNFTKTMTLPAGTVAMAFGYTGEARGAADEDTGTTSFFYIPVER